MVGRVDDREGNVAQTNQPPAREEALFDPSARQRQAGAAERPGGPFEQLQPVSIGLGQQIPGAERKGDQALRAVLDDRLERVGVRGPGPTLAERGDGRDRRVSEVGDVDGAHRHGSFPRRSGTKPGDGEQGVPERADLQNAAGHLDLADEERSGAIDQVEDLQIGREVIQRSPPEVHSLGIEPCGQRTV